LTGSGKKNEGDSVKAISSSATSTATATNSSNAKNRKQQQSSATVSANPSGSVSRKANHLKGSTAHIRHLYVDAQYRGKGLEEELVRHALSRAFGSDKRSAIHRVIIASPSYASPALISLLQHLSFVNVAAGDDAVVPGMPTPGHEESQGIMVKDTRHFGIAGWEIVSWSGKYWEITRSLWTERVKQRDE
jgi:predicted GNAT family acetyltransferase